MFGVILDLGEDLISCLCLGVKYEALVLNAMAENLDALNGGGWGIYSPNHQTNRWGWAAVDGRTGQSGAPATSPGCWVPTVGASDNWATEQSDGAPDRSCRLSGAPSSSALTSARTVAHLLHSADDRWREVVVAPLVHWTVQCYTGQSDEL